MNSLHSVFKEFDPECVERLMTENKEKKRKQIIKMFLLKSFLNNCRNLEDPKQFFLVKNVFNFCKISLLIAGGISFIAYKFIFTGIYEFRQFYFNTKNVPLWIKLPFCGFICYQTFVSLLLDYSYNYEIYQLAVNDLNNRNKI